MTLWVVAVKLCTLKEERTEQIEIVGGPCTCVLREQKKVECLCGLMLSWYLVMEGKLHLQRRYHTMSTTVVCLKKYLQGKKTCVHNSLMQC